jgi:hypothetical protein
MWSLVVLTGLFLLVVGWKYSNSTSESTVTKSTPPQKRKRHRPKKKKSAVDDNVSIISEVSTTSANYSAMSSVATTSSAPVKPRLVKQTDPESDGEWQTIPTRKSSQKSKPSLIQPLAKTETLTKKQRENQRKAQRTKEEKDALRQLQEDRLDWYRKEQEREYFKKLAEKDKKRHISSQQF